MFDDDVDAEDEAIDDVSIIIILKVGLLCRKCVLTLPSPICFGFSLPLYSHAVLNIILTKHYLAFMTPKHCHYRREPPK